MAKEKSSLSNLQRKIICKKSSSPKSTISPEITSPFSDSNVDDKTNMWPSDSNATVRSGETR